MVMVWRVGEGGGGGAGGKEKAQRQKQPMIRKGWMDYQTTVGVHTNWSQRHQILQKVKG